MELHNNPLPINGETKMEIIQLKYNTLLWKQAIDTLKNYAGDYDTIFLREI